MALSLGSDPEFFLVNEKGEFVSAIDVVKANKDNKVDLGNGCKLFYDNVLAEVNVVPGADPDTLVNNVHSCFQALTKAVRPYRIKPQASGTYPKNCLTHPDAQVFGCEPEFCAYEMNIVQAPECKTGFRSAGGHIHLGFSKEEYPLLAPLGADEDRTERDWGRVWVVRMMDLFMGIPSLWMDQDPTSPARRKLYGKAGTHRPKEEYGVEYRATSNFWLRSPALVKLAYSICSFVVQFVGEKRHLEMWKVDDSGDSVCTGYDVEALQSAINNSDKLQGKVFLNGLVKKYMPSGLYGQILVACEPAQNDFYKEWEL